MEHVSDFEFLVSSVRSAFLTVLNMKPETRNSIPQDNDQTSSRLVETDSGTSSVHAYDGLHRQMLPHHVGIQLRAFPLRLHRPFGHHHILLRKPGGEVEPLLDQ